MKSYSSESIAYGLRNENRGFHLQIYSDKDGCTFNSKGDQSVTESSLYDKQRIDSMFDETKSLLSACSINRDLVSSETRDIVQETSILAQQPKILNSVQERIEKMFTEINMSECVQEKNDKINHQYCVTYLGSIPLSTKITSLSSLQQPLRHLYFSYKRVNFDNKSKFQGVLKITKSGLKVIHDTEDGTFEQLNPFSTIAVWAAVKFVCKPKLSTKEKEYAFIPLITDPKSLSKVNLFRTLKFYEESLFMGSRYEDNLPLFAIVMKQIGLSRQLECHAFICSSADDAVRIATNLHIALVQAIPNMNPTCNPFERRNLIKHQSHPSSKDKKAPPFRMSNSSINNAPPERPPKKFIFQRDILPRLWSPDQNLHNFPDLTKENVIKENHSDTSKQFTTKFLFDKESEEEKTSSQFLGSQQYEIYNSINHASDHTDTGDIFTRVAIPRSKSFLKARGPFSLHYTSAANNRGSFSKLDFRKSSFGSPLGLNELFQEFRLHEGLYNIDDILNAIINYDGMSFNELKPIYKEFLLKLALTLTKDELYQRSKSIMHKQKRRRLEMKRRSSCRVKRSMTSASIIRKALRKSVINLRMTKKGRDSFDLTSLLFHSCHRDENNDSLDKINQINGSRLHDLSKSEPKKYNVEKVYEGIPSNQQIFQNKKSTTKIKPRDNKMTKMDTNYSKKDNFRKHKCLSRSRNYISASGSCAECSYDSESCTCSSTEKCYCSLSKSVNKQTLNTNENLNVSFSSCGCDTDSCLESEKCYCIQSDKLSAFEQLKQQGFAASDSSASLRGSFDHAWNNEKYVKPHIKNLNYDYNKYDLKSSKSLEFLTAEDFDEHKDYNSNDGELSNMENFFKNPEYEPLLQNNPSPLCKISDSALVEEGHIGSSSSDNLALDYEMFNQSSNNCSTKESSKNNRKVLVVSTRDPNYKLNYKGPSSQKSNSKSNLNHKYVIANEALSVKKNAEIAAVFSQVMSKKDEIIYNTLEPQNISKFSKFKGGYGDSNLEYSLGYFP